MCGWDKEPVNNMETSEIRQNITLITPLFGLRPCFSLSPIRLFFCFCLCFPGIGQGRLSPPKQFLVPRRLKVCVWKDEATVYDPANDSVDEFLSVVSSKTMRKVNGQAPSLLPFQGPPSLSFPRTSDRSLIRPISSFLLLLSPLLS